MFKEQEATLIFRGNSITCCKGASSVAVLAKFQMQIGSRTDLSRMNQLMKDLIIISFLRLSTIMKRNINRILFERGIKKSKKN